MSILSLQEFMKKYNLKNDTMNGSELQKVFTYSKYPRDSKIYSDKGLVNIDDGSMGGTHWTLFYIKDNKSSYFYSFGGQRDDFLVEQLPKPMIYYNYKIQDINSR